MSFYTQKELQGLGFKFIGDNVLVSKKASFYGIKNISIDDNSRVDDFCVFSSSSKGEICIGKNVHIAIYSSLIGQEDIVIDDYANISSRVSIYSSSDDFSGSYMTNPTLPSEITNILSSPVHIHKHVIIGSGSVVLPGVTINIGAGIGSLSLVKGNIPSFKIFAGNPIRYLKDRKESMVAMGINYEKK